MYTTSAAYKTAIASKLLKSRIVITITPNGGTPVTVTNNRLVPRSVVYTNKSSKNSDFSFGAAYVGQFNFTLLNVDDAFDRYSLYGAKVVPVFYQTLANNQEESIPIGEFYVEEPKRSKKTIAVKCYDAMTKFDVPQVVDTFGTPYQLLDLICTTCGVPLGMTEEEVEALPNGTEQLTMTAERVRTCRDALSYISTVLCGFATINRSGQLEIRQYASTANYSVSKARRTTSTISDYTTYFIGVKARFLQSGNWINVSANVQGATSGLVLDLGDLPMVQGVNETLSRVAQTIANELGEIDFTPSEVSMNGDPSVDLGDFVEYPNANNTSDTVYTYVTSLSWTYRGVSKLKGEGGNARLNAVTDYQTKQVVTLETDAAVNEYAMKFYTNSEQYSVGSDDRTIIVLNYSVNKDTTTAFACTIPFVMNLDGNLVFTFALGNETIGTFTHYVPRGYSVVTLTNYIVNTGNSQNRLSVSVHAEYFESDNRRQDAKIGGLIDFTTTSVYTERSIDTTVPTGTIPHTGIRAYIFASGINVTDSWDGTLLIIDRISPVELSVPNITVQTLYEDFDAHANDHHERSVFADVAGLITLSVPNIDVVAVTESIFMGRKTTSLTISPSRATDVTFNATYVNVGETAFALRTDYSYVGVAETIDSGYLTSMQIPLDMFDTVDELTVASTFVSSYRRITEDGKVRTTETGATRMTED